MPEIVLVAVGSELLNGIQRDANTQALGQIVSEHFGRLDRSITIADDRQKMIDTIEDCLARYDVVIVSGGLGPTQDDITRDVIEELCAKPLMFSREAYEVAQKHYARIGKQIDENHHYALAPKDFNPLENPKGLAPGLWFYAEYEQSLLIVTPGVPVEFEAMMREQAWAVIASHFPSPDEYSARVTIRSRFVPEEKIFSKGDDLWEKLSAFGVVASLPQVAGVDVVVHLKAHNQSALDAKKNDLLEFVSSCSLADAIWHIGEESLAELVVALAIKKQLKIGAAESCTAGLITDALGSVAGASACLQGAVVCYANAIKENVLGVAPELIESNGAVSEAVAIAMAEGGRRVLGANLCVATTGIAGPAGGSSEKPVGTLCYAVASDNETDVFSYHGNGDRQRLRNRFTVLALHALLDAIRTA